MRRMLESKIINSDRFCEMPATARALYLHFAVEVDDDGFVANPKNIMRTANASEDDIKILVSKNFIIPFESGVVVLTHHRIHNYLQNDRYKPTEFQAELLKLQQTKGAVYVLDTGCIQTVSDLDAKCISTNKQTNNNKRTKTNKQTLALFEDFWSAYPRKVSKAMAERSFEKLNPDTELVKTMLAAIAAFCESEQWLRDGGQYIPYPSTWLNQRRWEDEGVNTAQAAKAKLSDLFGEEVSRDKR